MITILTSCGHTVVMDRKVSEMTIGATFDCKTCDKLEILTDDMDVTMNSKDFHLMLHEQSKARGDEFVWPKDGAGTGILEI